MRASGKMEHQAQPFGDGEGDGTPKQRSEEGVPLPCTDSGRVGQSCWKLTAETLYDDASFSEEEMDLGYLKAEENKASEVIQGVRVPHSSLSAGEPRTRQDAKGEGWDRPKPSSKGKRT